jgi:endonuclease YncB( thermonuclease family)
MAEGFISYMKYRQPVSIFPLTKEGKPWTAGLNGMVENTAIEHLKLQSDRAADKMGFMFGVAKDLFLHWTSEMPPDIGYGGIYDVIPGSIEDGDTIKIMNGTTAETVRIKGFDAGELKDEGLTKRGGPNEVFMGNLARTRLKELIAQSGGKVEVIRNKPDNYARTVGEVTVKVNGRDVADILREEGLVLNYASGSPKKLYYNKFPGGAEQVWGEKLQEYRRNNPNSESITPLLNTLNRTENQTLRNDALVVNPNSQPTQ